MSQIKTVLLGVWFVMLSGLTWAQSSGGSTSPSSESSFGEWSARANSRESSRWTLQSWLAQKQRNSLMDQWLSMNSPSPFEFYLKGGYSSYQSRKDQNVKKDYASYSGAVGAYAQAVGITAEYENNLNEHYSDVVGMLNIRILGNSLQTTSITLHGGQRTRQFSDSTVIPTISETVRNTFGQITLQSYFTRYFGIIGSYRGYIPTKNSSVGEVSGTLTECGIFLDFKGLRIYGNWYSDLQTNKADTGIKTKYDRTGLKSGIQIFF